MLYAAARAQHAAEVIRPALEKQQVVICDRFTDSSVAYQGAGRGLGEAHVEELSTWGTDDLQPDLVILLDVEPEVGLSRIAGDLDRLEAAGSEFHQLVNDALRRRARGDERYLVVDGTLPIDEIHERVRRTVLRMLGVVGV